MLNQLRQEVYEAHMELERLNLVKWTSGNVSGRDADSGLIVIKPSGVRYHHLSPENMVVVDLAGQVVEGTLAPSVDLPTHLYVYRHRPDVYGIVHTHSPFATAFAAVGEAIPAVLTAIADEFGGPIPCGAYSQIGEEEIGAEIIRSIGSSTAILLQNHGVFTIGKNPTAALKAAVMTEDVAKTVFLAKQIGVPKEIPAEEVRRAHARYVNKYGQPARPDARKLSPTHLT